MSLSPEMTSILSQLSSHIEEIVDAHLAAIDSFRIARTIDARIEVRVDARVDAQVDARLTSRVAQAVDARVSSQLELRLQAHDESCSLVFNSLLADHSASFKKIYDENKGYIDDYQQ
ncbi:hypothetical protein CROQUDRAFT_86528 [Cronartium quercuum f. sp. fusiforme G11]|uniref:Uncharacterized protein n=1 Tax=Cronartium quercuum f. sp. fusiforme G11 TaxID=708437 RepID=A0A9P6NSP3_9BASI|nr:hypothetical protein CROQUDRAFT_86528 [Cronartium quercuum f. sp. fusiforme G11]